MSEKKAACGIPDEITEAINRFHDLSFECGEKDGPGYEEAFRRCLIRAALSAERLYLTLREALGRIDEWECPHDYPGECDCFARVQEVAEIALAPATRGGTP